MKADNKKKKTSTYEQSLENNTAFKVEEQFVSYATTSVSSSNLLSFRTKIKEGVNFDFYNKLSHQLDFTEENWADILSLSSKSLQRYSKDKEFRFKPIHSEKLIEIAEVVDLGKSILGSIEYFNIWMNTPNITLGNIKPKELITDSYGKQMLIDELYRIEYAIFA